MRASGGRILRLGQKRPSLTNRPKSNNGNAVRHILGHEGSFRLFLSHADIPMHNDLSELLLRGPAVGRMNWLFSRSEGGTKTGAVMFTLIGSCMRQGLDPLTYLSDILNRLASHLASKVHQLTPKNRRIANALTTLTPLSSAGAASPGAGSGCSAGAQGGSRIPGNGRSSGPRIGGRANLPAEAPARRRPGPARIGPASEAERTSPPRPCQSESVGAGSREVAAASAQTSRTYA